MSWAVHSEWGESHARVLEELRAVISTIAEFETVRLLVPPKRMRQARQQRFPDSVKLMEAPVDDIWLRDICPTFAISDGKPVAIDWNFNGWGSTRDRPRRPGDKVSTLMSFGCPRIAAPFIAEGGAFITDGHGTFITTKSCLLNPNRNPITDQHAIEVFLRSIGARKVIWLEGDPEEPITSGHIDGYVMFTSCCRLLVEGPSGNGGYLDEIRTRDIELLSNARNADGIPFTLRIFAPPSQSLQRGRGPLFAPVYLNSYLANGAVIAPCFGEPESDKRAEEVLKTEFPGRVVRMLNIEHIASGGGGIRCLTQPVPKHD
ncbi:agmatine deiminase family protein [Bradyrhizobium sp. 17]|nr:agmatine deiminase family protein [Bradyrhizobium sp. 17]